MIDNGSVKDWVRATGKKWQQPQVGQQVPNDSSMFPRERSLNKALGCRNTGAAVHDQSWGVQQ